MSSAARASLNAQLNMVFPGGTAPSFGFSIAFSAGSSWSPAPRMSDSSSVNITVRLVRLPYRSDTWAPGWVRTVDATDSIGVMPDPAAMHRCRSPVDGSACQEPDGVCTSIRVPGCTKVCASSR